MRLGFSEWPGENVAQRYLDTCGEGVSRELQWMRGSHSDKGVLGIQPLPWHFCCNDNISQTITKLKMSKSESNSQSPIQAKHTFQLKSAELKNDMSIRKQWLQTSTFESNADLNWRVIKKSCILCRSCRFMRSCKEAGQMCKGLPRVQSVSLGWSRIMLSFV